MIAGLSESSSVRHQLTDYSPHVTAAADERRTNVNLDHELRMAEVTSTGTNTVTDVVVMEDQATETGQQQHSVILFFFKSVYYLM